MSYKFDTLFCVKYLRSRSTINFPSEADNEDDNLYRVAQKKTITHSILEFFKTIKAMVP